MPKAIKSSLIWPKRILYNYVYERTNSPTREPVPSFIHDTNNTQDSRKFVYIPLMLNYEATIPEYCTPVLRRLGNGQIQIMMNAVARSPPFVATYTLRNFNTKALETTDSRKSCDDDKEVAEQ